MATWPSLPNPLVDGYTLSPVDQTVRTDMEVGSPRVRRRTSARNDQVDVNWRFTDAQMATFRTWFDSSDNCAGGASWFTIDLPIGATGMESHECRFIGAWQAQALPGLNWQVTAKLEVRA